MQMRTATLSCAILAGALDPDFGGQEAQFTEPVFVDAILSSRRPRLLGRAVSEESPLNRANDFEQNQKNRVAGD